MEWTEDPKTMETFDRLMIDIYPNIISYMDSMRDYMTNEPNSVMLRLLARCIHFYNVGRTKMNSTEVEAMAFMMESISGDPELQVLMQAFGQGMMNKQVGLE